MSAGARRNEGRTDFTVDQLMQALARKKVAACLAERTVVVHALTWLSVHDTNPLLTYDSRMERILSRLS